MHLHMDLNLHLNLHLYLPNLLHLCISTGPRKWRESKK